MLGKNEKLIEKYGQEDRIVFLVTSEPKKGVREADRIEEKEWSWVGGKCTMVYNTIETFLNNADAIKYQEYISYLPFPHYVVEATAKAEDLITACDSDFGIKLGYMQVAV